MRRGPGAGSASVVLKATSNLNYAWQPLTSTSRGSRIPDPGIPAHVGYNPAVLSRSLWAPWWIHAVMAVTVAVLALGLTMTFHLQERPFVLPMIAVLVSALSGGLVAGLICGIVSLGLVNYYIAPPVAQFEAPSLRETYELLVFALTATTISALAALGRQSRLTLEATVASIGDGVIVTDPNGRVRFLNAVAENLTGWSAREARGQPVSEIFNVVRE